MARLAPNDFRILFQHHRGISEFLDHYFLHKPSWKQILLHFEVFKEICFTELLKASLTAISGTPLAFSFCSFTSSLLLCHRICSAYARCAPIYVFVLVSFCVKFHLHRILLQCLSHLIAGPLSYCHDTTSPVLRTDLKRNIGVTSNFCRMVLLSVAPAQHICCHHTESGFNVLGRRPALSTAHCHWPEMTLYFLTSSGLVSS